MHFLRTKKLHIATLFISVFIGGFAWMLVGPAILQATTFNPPTDPYEFNPETGNYGGPATLPAAADKPSDLGYDPSGVFAPATPGGAPGSQPIATEESAATVAANQLKDDQAAQMTCFGGMTGLRFNFNGCVAQVMNFAMWVSARTLWIAGVLLNMTLHYTLNLNTLLERLPVVDIGWKVLRDLANIVFIFVALWCGMSITLGIGDNGKKAWGLLAQMVLVALFMNFSLFITKAVVDVSNVAALHFYSLIVEPGKEGDYDSGLSESFLYGLKLSTLYNTNDRTQTGLDTDNYLQSAAASGATKTPLSFTNIILIGLFGSLFIIVTAWVFFAAAIMFIYRAITLIMLMMLSPLAFVGLILPGASGMAHQWWSKLWSQAFFAPLYLALAYVVVKTINAPAFQESFNTAGFASAITGTGTNSIAIIFNFVILICLMVGCLVVAESLGAKGSDMAMAGWEKIKGGAIGVASAGARGLIKLPSTAVEGGGNIGKGMQKLVNSRLLNNKVFGNFKDTRIGKGINAAGEKTQEKLTAVRTVGQFMDPRYMEERLGQTKLGNTFIGQAVRGVTTGALAHANIGGKSLEEAYEEDEERASKRHVIGNITKARQAGAKLDPLHEKEEHLETGKEDATKEVAKQKEAIEGAKAGLTPEQQKTVREKEKALAEAKAFPPDQQKKIEEKKAAVAQSQKSLEKAEADAKNNPTPENTQKVTDLQEELKTKKEELTEVEEIKPDHQARIKTAEDELKTAKTAGLTQDQRNAIKLAEDAVTLAQTKLEAEKAKKPDPADQKNVDEAQKNLEKVGKDIEAMEKELEAAKASKDLVKMANAPALEEKIRKAKEDPGGALQDRGGKETL
ncbi:MAG: hypothetical protein UY50_C0023G0025 [Parcubacteria group bacterium GW2011_GWA2_49_9]|nr:MAG: hypothetical protein UY50_C0023G0025 [Parcubacteria group bacterium GW2011_GWA2_49_9]